MKNENVGIGEIKICSTPDVLKIVGLGSCVGVALYHEKTKTGGLVHIMLPNGELKNGVKPGKYANTAVERICKELKFKVGDTGKLVAKIAGGAQMFKAIKGFAIGERNVETVKEELAKHKIKIISEDCGKNYGRTITFTPENGELKIKSIYGEMVI